MKNLVERLAILSEGSEVSADEATSVMPGESRRRAAPSSNGAARFVPGQTFRDQVEQAEREIIIGALAAAKDNVTEAARMLDLERGHFYKKMKALGMRRGGDAEKAEGDA